MPKNTEENLKKVRNHLKISGKLLKEIDKSELTLTQKSYLTNVIVLGRLLWESLNKIEEAK